MRYDRQFLETISTDSNNISPRAGFAWSPFQSRHTVVRGSFGLFNDRVPLRALANAILSAGNTTDLNNLSQIAVSFSPAQAGAPVFPNTLSGVVPLVTLVNFTTMNPHMQNAYSQQGSFEIEQQIGESTTLSLGYQHLRGLHLIVLVNQNVPTCVASGNNNGCRPNPNYANNSQYSSLADSHYDGLHVSFLQRPVRWGNYRISYTWSKSLNNVGEFFFSSPIDPTNIWQDYGRSDDDQAPSHIRWRYPVSNRTSRHPMAAHQPRIPVERDASVLFGIALQYHVGVEHHPRHCGTPVGERSIHQPQCRYRQRFLQRERPTQPRFPG